MNTQSPPPPSLPNRSEKEREVKKTDKFPEVTKILREAMKHAHSVGKTGGEDMDFTFNEKLQSLFQSAIHKTEKRMIKDVLWLLDCHADGLETNGFDTAVVEDIRKRIINHFGITNHSKQI